MQTSSTVVQPVLLVPLVLPGISDRFVREHLDAYDAFEPFGTNVDRNGQALRPGDPKPLPQLTSVERAVYHRVLDPDWTGNRRIEQERIPLSTTVAAITASVHQLYPKGRKDLAVSRLEKLQAVKTSNGACSMRPR